MDQNKLQYIWGQLSVERNKNMERQVKSVTHNGDYASWNIKQGVNELLLNASDNWSDAKMPNWEGMRFSVERIHLENSEQYVVMELLDKELEIPFACFCADVIESMADVVPANRAKVLASVIHIWDQFFTHSGDKTLPQHKQRGLFAELFWLRKLILSAAMTEVVAVEAWKGSLKKIHDFEYKGEVVEVKSTVTKEPRKIVISNERQLDDHQLVSLHLFVLTLDVHETGESLPGIVQEIVSYLGKCSISVNKFERKLLRAGYVNADAEKYTYRYTKRHEELFEVQEGFPRIIALPGGTGDLRYSVQISACKPFQCDLEEHLGMRV